jgi:Caspase recruitment domain
MRAIRRHAVILLNISDECGDNLPLDDKRSELLTTNYSQLTELLNSDEVVSLMFSKQCINSRHKEAIQAKQTSFDKNEQLLKIMFLRSITDFKIFIRCLKETGQAHLAECLTEEGGMALLKFNTFKLIGC